MSLTMNRFQPPQLLAIFLALILTMGAFSLSAFGSTGDDGNTLIVNAVWLDGERIRLEVTDSQSDTRSSLVVPLSDYLKDGDNSEFISIQAVDENGNQSGVIEIKNPFYNPHLANTENQVSTGTESAITANIHNTDSNTDSNQRPLTPDGTGSVIDSVDESDGKEFFTIYSEDGNQFYLIIDRQRNSENVYFLNTVTEEDLISLAKQSGREIVGNGTSAIPTPEQPVDIADENEQPPTDNENTKSETHQSEPTSAMSRIISNLALIVGIAVVVGGIAYYFKIIKPRKESEYDNHDGNEEVDDPYGIDEAMDEEMEDFERRDGR